ncbi:MAG TPA: hypothetical protein LFV91_07080 [Rickettsia endosymbiont of Bembidion nr. Transversale]|nr:hypothetical protein [Rickettsia endosymbiont of Bembidion nr. Transversale]
MPIDNIKIIAHRGEGPTSLIGKKFPTEILPENSISAFSKSFDDQADGIELDVFLSKDKEVMVIHDDELWRNVYNIDRTGAVLPKQGIQQSSIINQEFYNTLEPVDQELVQQDNKIWQNFSNAYIMGTITRYRKKNFRISTKIFDELMKKYPNLSRDDDKFQIYRDGRHESYIISKEEYEKLAKHNQEAISKDNKIWNQFHNTYIHDQDLKEQEGIRVSKHTYSELVKKYPNLKKHFKTISYPISSSVLSETQESFKIGNKTFEELKRLSIGYNQEAIPRLEEVLMIVLDYNTRKKGENLIINIELKDQDAGVLALKTCNKYVDNHTIKWEDIIFCSFKHECLQEMVTYNKENKLAKPLQLAPSIKTATLFNEKDVNPETFKVDKGANYSQEGLKYLKDLVEGKEWVAYDAVVWDIKKEFIDLVKEGNKTTPENKKALHLSTSDYRIFNNKKLFNLLIEAASDVPIFFKTDEPKVFRKMLEEHHKAYKEKKLKSDLKSIKDLLLDKPKPFSKISKNKRGPWRKQRKAAER